MKKILTALREAVEAAAATDNEAAPAYAKLRDGIDWSAEHLGTTPSTLPVVDRWFEASCRELGDGPMAALGRAPVANADDPEWMPISGAYEDDPALNGFPPHPPGLRSQAAPNWPNDTLFKG